MIGMEGLLEQKVRLHYFRSHGCERQENASVKLADYLPNSSAQGDHAREECGFSQLSRASPRGPC
jgi:hypothetical protein